jgi:hypothetical protein
VEVVIVVALFLFASSSSGFIADFDFLNQISIYTYFERPLSALLERPPNLLW